VPKGERICTVYIVLQNGAGLRARKVSWRTQLIGDAGRFLFFWCQVSLGCWAPKLLKSV